MRRLYSLDILRGVAALSVVVWHWQHFFALYGADPLDWQDMTPPLHLLLAPFYEAGWAAVDIFFVLSGFIFFWLYSGSIAAHRLSAARFFVWRASRLYPLFLISLVAVLVLQPAYSSIEGRPFIFPLDLTRLPLALLLADQWIPPGNPVLFNGTAWSISVEVLLYVAFFVLCRTGFKGWRMCLVIVLVGLGLLFGTLADHIARGLIGFFAGGAIWHFVEWARLRPDATAIARRLFLAAAIGWALTAAEMTSHLLRNVLALFASGSVSMQGVYATQIANLLLALFVLLVAVPTVAALALHGHLRPPAKTRFALLGDISYSVYLLHFPLQVAVAAVAVHYAVPIAFFMQPWVMAAFFTALIGLGSLSHYAFERPVQHAWRRASGLAAADQPSSAASSTAAVASSQESSAAAISRTRSARSLARNAASVGRL